jgi:thiol-disulfide isomerase/thioredoxin
MLQKTILFITILYFGLVYSQSTITMRGNISAKGNAKDTINFYCANIKNYYYDTNTLSAGIINNEFTVNFNFSYPHLYAMLLKSENKKGVAINDFVFLDNTTTKIKFDSNSKLEASNGISNTEYLKTFMPFMLKDKKKNLNFYLFNNHELDTNLLGYIEKYPDSYVALWYLIQKFSITGYSELYEKSLNSFSKKIKTEKLWKILNNDFQKITIKTNVKFPELLLKDINLKPEVLVIPNNKFTLIDMWFSGCTPCLKQIPVLKEIYNKYSSLGFNIVGISVDQTRFLDLWKGKIIEKEIPWKQYLDENAVIASKEKIISFPTNFLLNEKGEVIGKNIEPEELEEFLKKKLSN